MFQKNKDNNEDVPETIIGPSVIVEGDFTGKGNVVVEGIVNGNLTTDQHLEVKQNARISADVSADSAIIAGEILGNLKTNQTLELKSTSKVTGDIETPLLSVEAGSMINGKCCMVPKNNSSDAKKDQVKEV